MKLADILVTSLRRIENAGGDVLHGMKQSDVGYTGLFFFGVCWGNKGLEASYSDDDECGGTGRASAICVSLR